MTANRPCAPDSKLGVWECWLETVYLSSCQGLQLRHMYEAMDMFYEHAQEWVLETNDDTISLEDAACGYKSLMVIERCFRSFKRTQIKMTPMYHWLSRRIEAHVKICVLALMIERIAELSCDKPWPTIRRRWTSCK
jgi:hypothetical protein